MKYVANLGTSVSKIVHNKPLENHWYRKTQEDTISFKEFKLFQGKASKNHHATDFFFLAKKRLVKFQMRLTLLLRVCYKRKQNLSTKR